MSSWGRRVRGALGLGVTWAIGWAVFGIMLGATSNLLPSPLWDRLFEFYDAPLTTLAIPGFIGGALFAGVLGFSARHHRFDELSLGRFTGWGALGGFLLSLLPAGLHAVGLATITDPARVTALMAVPLTLLGAASAAGSLIVARRADRATLTPERAPAP